MAPDRRRLNVLLGVLGVVAIIGVYAYWPSAPDVAVARTGARGQAGRSPGVPTLQAPDVRLDDLSGERPKPVSQSQRDLFRFRPKAPPPRPAWPPPGASGPSAAPLQTPTAPLVPPITLRFIGLVEMTEQGSKVAILTDGRGLYQGREGDIIEGRYRILRIGVESVDVAHLDGRGRQTIRLSGS